MKNTSFLKKVKYRSATPSLSTSGLKNHRFSNANLPLMKIEIDFETGNLEMQGDWQYLVSSNKHNADSWYMYHRERVKINATILSAMPINLNNAAYDGVMFPLEGLIKDGKSTGNCSGLLVVDNVRTNNGNLGKQWNVTFYLYDTQCNNCEITFKLPVYKDDHNKIFN